MWDELLNDIDKEGLGKINFEQFSDHMMELIEKGHYSNRDVKQNEVVTSKEAHGASSTNMSQQSALPSTEASTIVSGETHGTTPIPKLHQATNPNKKRGRKFGGMRMKVNGRAARGTMDTYSFLEAIIQP